MLKNKKIFRILITSILYFISISANASIVTTIKPLGFIASAIADKITSVEVIIPNSYIMNNYSLRPLDILKIKQADFIVLTDNKVESSFLKKIIHKFKKKILY
ncbi:metal ABC transporter solute-binding protein, Zn/Mn family [Buchnera aphidicola]|nr:zinc ABC transporter substrate-binding protein [Buchnera aphidicola]